MASQTPPLGTPLDHFRLVFDYIKFHLGLYVATPPILAGVATALSVASSPYFLAGFGVLVLLCFISGVHASYFMGTHLNRRWDTGAAVDWESDAANLLRRVMQHYLYWGGLIAALAGLALAVATKQPPGTVR